MDERKTLRIVLHRCDESPKPKTTTYTYTLVETSSLGLDIKTEEFQTEIAQNDENDTFENRLETRLNTDPDDYHHHSAVAFPADLDRAPKSSTNVEVENSGEDFWDEQMEDEDELVVPEYSTQQLDDPLAIAVPLEEIKCKICSIGSKSASDIQRHEMTVHGFDREDDPSQGPSTEPVRKSTYECPLCEKSFFEGRNVQNHLHKIHGLPYEKCDDILPLNWGEVQRELQGQCPSTFACTLCLKTFNCTEEIQYHLREVHGILRDQWHQMYAENHAGVGKSGFSAEVEKVKQLDDPLVIDELMTIILCKICGVESRNSLDLRKHEISAHGYNRSKNSRGRERIRGQGQGHSSSSVASFPCPICADIFPSRTNMRLHLRRVHQLPRRTEQDESQGQGQGRLPSTRTSFTCPVCQKIFATPTNIHRHWKDVHQLSRDERSKLYQKYLKPVLLNEKLESFICPICQKVLAHKCNMKRHFRQVHQLSEKEVNIASCRIEAGPAGQATRVRNVKGIFACPLPLCNKTFTQYGNIPRHFEQVHKFSRQEALDYYKSKGGINNSRVSLKDVYEWTGKTNDLTANICKNLKLESDEIGCDQLEYYKSDLTAIDPLSEDVHPRLKTVHDMNYGFRTPSARFKFNIVCPICLGKYTSKEIHGHWKDAHQLPLSYRSRMYKAYYRKAADEKADGKLESDQVDSSSYSNISQRSKENYDSNPIHEDRRTVHKLSPHQQSQTQMYQNQEYRDDDTVTAQPETPELILKVENEQKVEYLEELGLEQSDDPLAIDTPSFTTKLESSIDIRTHRVFTDVLDTSGVQGHRLGHMNVISKKTVSSSPPPPATSTFQCPFCEKCSFVDRTETQDHLLIEHCLSVEKCLEIFPREYKRKGHGTTTFFTCSLCQKEFTAATEIGGHWKRVHYLKRSELSRNHNQETQVEQLDDPLAIDTPSWALGWKSGAVERNANRHVISEGPVKPASSSTQTTFQCPICKNYRQDAHTHLRRAHGLSEDKCWEIYPWDKSEQEGQRHVISKRPVRENETNNLEKEKSSFPTDNFRRILPRPRIWDWD